MPNVLDTKKIIDRLNQDQDTELMRYELELMLERELAKPASEMDVQLVDELLGALGEESSMREKQVLWESIEKQTHRTANRCRLTALQRVAAIVLVLFSVTFISIGSAYAFHWTFLLKFLQPLAETFGIYSYNNSTVPQPEQSRFLYTVEEAPSEQTDYTSAGDMPAEWDGFRVQPTWIPERFEFLQGSMYEDESVAVFTASYSSGNDFFNLVTTFFINDEDVVSYEYQKAVENPIIEVIAGQQVTHYRNFYEESLSASWINRNAHYSVVGDVTSEELRMIIEGLA